MSSETSSRSTRPPILPTNSVSNAVDSTVKGGAALPKEWTSKTRFASSAAAFFNPRNAIAAIATRTDNCAGRTLQMSHDRNVQGNGTFNATPVAALARGALDTQKPAAQA